MTVKLPNLLPRNPIGRVASNMCNKAVAKKSCRILEEPARIAITGHKFHCFAVVKFQSQVNLAFQGKKRYENVG